MAEGAKESAALVMDAAKPDLVPLLKVCSFLNEAGARYLIVGGQAVILHGLVRTTEDVDILIEATEENARRVLAGLVRLADGAARELTPRDLLENVVVKIADEVEVDVSIHAWTLSYADAIGSSLQTTIDGVCVPYVGWDALLVSKQTYREKDQLDLLQLRALKNRP